MRFGAPVTDLAPQFPGSFSQATVFGGFVFTSGQVGIDAVDGSRPDGSC